MKSLRRTVLAVSAVVGCAVLGQATALAQPPGAIAAGQYRNTTQEAGFFYFDGSTSLNIDVTDIVNTSAPHGGARTTNRTTRLNLQASDSTGLNVSGCYDISPNDISFSAGAAALHTHITADNGTCGGPPGSLIPPFTIDVTWTGNAPVTSTSNNAHFSCGPYNLETAITTTGQGASAVASLSPILTGTFTAPEFQVLRSTDQRMHATGVQPDNCQPFGATPGGAGPPPAGDYRSSSTMADVFFTTDAGTFVDVNVNDMTQQSTPKIGPATNTTQFQLGIQAFGGGTFANGCFLLTPSDFTSNGVQRAELKLFITTDTPPCFPGAQTDLPLPLTVDVVWSGSGPVATTRSVGSLTCLTYRNQGTAVNVTNNTNVTATLSPLLSQPFSTSQGSLATGSSIDHAQGAQQPACHL